MNKNKKFKNLISIFLCVFLVFGTSVSTQAAVLTSQVSAQSVEPIIIEKSYIQQMLDKLQQILNLLSKKGNITVECIDNEGNVISSQTYTKLKFGTYTYDAPEIEGYTLADEAKKSTTISRKNKDAKITFTYNKNVEKPGEGGTENPGEGDVEQTIEKVYLVNALTYTDYIENSFVIATSGQVQSQNTYKCTQMVEIPSDVTSLYLIQPLIGYYSYHVGAFYDENQKYICGMCQQERDNCITIPEDTKDTIEIKVPEGAKYVRLSSASNGDLPSAYCYTSKIKVNKDFVHESNETYTVTNVEEMKSLNCKTGDIVITKGYSTENDNGQAKYEVVTYEEFNSLLPKDVAVQYNPEKRTYQLTPVDEYGNHTLNNGLVARIITDNKVTPEQYGAKGDGETNDVYPFIHLFAQTKTGEINFRENATYIIGTMSGTTKALDNPYRVFTCGGLLGGQVFDKPIMMNVHDLKLNGNNCLVTIPNGKFGDSGMGIFNAGCNVNGLEISGFRFDGKGRTLYSDNKNSNHTIFYAPGGFKTTNPILLEYCPNYVDGELVTGQFNNVSIHDNEFFDAGAMYKKAGDAGGDFILVVNPTEANGIYIENNTFKAPGRWVFAIDLGGHGERLYNIKFNHNTVIGSNAMKTLEDGTKEYILETPKDMVQYNEDYWRWRQLGLIDFEAKKCFSNVEMIGNDINCSAGWAINGNSRESNNFLIKDNTWIHCGGGYPYGFELYSGFLKDVTFENNYLANGNNKLGLMTQNAKIINNTMSTAFRTFGICGDIIFENNKRIDGNFNPCWSHENSKGNNIQDEYLTYDQVKKIGCRVVYKNNESGFTGNFTNFEDLSANNYMSFEISGNKLQKIGVTLFGIDNVEFNPEQFNQEYVAQTKFVKGCRFTNPMYIGTLGGGFYKKGETIVENMQKLGVIGGQYWNDRNGIEDFNRYNGCNWGAFADRNNIEKIDMICTQDGYVPDCGKYYFTDSDNYFEAEREVGEGTYVYTDDNLYRIVQSGKLGKEMPDHTSGIETNGTAKLAYVCKLAKYELKYTYKNN